MSYLFFTSYARDNRKSPADEEDLRRFITDLANEIRQLEKPATGEIEFFDTQSIETGESWPQDLAHALATSRLCVALYSPSYFNSKWCGKEFQVFLQRHKAWKQAAANAGKSLRCLFPVIWIPPRSLPSSLKEIQYSNDKYPKAYTEGGLRQLLRLSKYKDAYLEFVQVLAGEMAEAALRNELPSAAPPSLSNVESAFTEASTEGVAAIRMDGGVAKACFVFIAGSRNELGTIRQSTDGYGTTDGWDWRPYFPEAPLSVGAMAQELSGQSNLRFQEIPCDADLPKRLREAMKNRVPTVLIADAWSLKLATYEAVMAEYDQLNLSNCACLVPWNQGDPETASSEAGLKRQLVRVFSQKWTTPPPCHEWESIRSMEDLRSRTKLALDDVRMRLLRILLNEADVGDVRKVESANLAASASAQGIAPAEQPQLLNNLGTSA